jgi:hypothetical protein
MPDSTHDRDRPMVTEEMRQKLASQPSVWDMQPQKIDMVAELEQRIAHAYSFIEEHMGNSDSAIHAKITKIEKILSDPRKYIYNDEMLPKTQFIEVYMPAKIDELKAEIVMWEQQLAYRATWRRLKKPLDIIKAREAARKHAAVRREYMLVVKAVGASEKEKLVILRKQYARSSQASYMEFEQWCEFNNKRIVNNVYIPPTKTEAELIEEFNERTIMFNTEKYIPDPAMGEEYKNIRIMFIIHRKTGGDFRWDMAAGKLIHIDPDGQDTTG